MAMRGRKGGTMCNMRTTIDDSGRLLIPEAVRQQAGLQPGIPLDVSWRDGHIEIAPASAAVNLERRGRFLVAVADAVPEPLTVESIEDLRQSILQERDDALWSLSETVSPRL
jgi:AbrB family looped-hinge helix DNA binding protein